MRMIRRNAPRVRAVHRLRLLCAGLILVAACGGDATGPKHGPPATVRLVSGDAQAGAVATELAAPLVVQVVDAEGRSVPGAAVAWSAAGGSLRAAAPTTDASGRAQAFWTLGTGSGRQQATAVAGVASASFSAEAAAGPVETVQVQPDTVRFSAIGDTVRLAATGSDRYGNAVPGAPVAWTALDPAVALVEGDGRVRAAGVGGARVVATSGAAADTVAVQVTQLPATLRLASDSVVLNSIGAEAPLAALARDRNGHLLTDPVVVWSSLDPAVAVVASGTVRSVGRGTARIVASTGPAADTGVVVVRQVAATLAVSPASLSLVAGEAATLAAAVADSAGTAIPDAQVAWSSSDPAVAAVSGAGVVAAQAAGSAVVTASLAGSAVPAVTVAVKVGTALPASDAVTTALPAACAATTPAPLAATLAATGGAGGYSWSVVSGGLPLGLTLSADGRLAGTPAQAGRFTVGVRVRDAAGQTATRDLSLSVCDAAVTLAVGETHVRRFPDACGVVLPAGTGTLYRVAVVPRDVRSSGRVAETVPGGLMLRATTEPASSTSVAAAAPYAAPSRASFEVELDPETLRLAARTEALHMRLRAEELERYGGRPIPARLGPPMAGYAPVDPPQTRTFTVANPAGGESLSVPATLRVNGTNLVYYQDDGVVGTSGEATDAEIQAVLDYYDRYGKPVIDNVFGGLGPEGTTSNFLGGPRNAADLDDNGKVILLQLRSSYMLGGAAAYVTSCDRYPRQENYAAGQFYCSNSNEGEVAYILRPKTSFSLGTVVHEVKHISSHGYAVYGGRGFNPSWIEEGTAEIAKEKSSRLAAGFADGQELGVFDVFPGGSITAATYGMGIVHSRTRSFLRAAPTNALAGNPNPNPRGSTYYGASWLFHRYLADAYAAGGEAGFFRAMNVGGIGTERIEEVTGQGFAALQTEFAAALALEGTAAARAAAAKRYRSYDFVDVGSAFGSEPWHNPLAVAEYGAADRAATVSFTGVSFFDLTGTSAVDQRLDLLQTAGAPVAADVDGVLIVTRVR